MRRFTILGIDQGLASCGYGVIQFKETKKGITFEKVLTYGVIKTTPKNTNPERLMILHNKITELVDTYKPTTIACEKLFYTPAMKGKRNKSASIVTTSMVTGIVFFIAGQKNLIIKEFVPSSVKKTITGNGTASKEDIITAIPKLMNLDDGVVKIEHQADALSIAYTAAFRDDLEEEETKKTKTTKTKTKSKKENKEDSNA